MSTALRRRPIRLVDADPERGKRMEPAIMATIEKIVDLGRRAIGLGEFTFPKGISEALFNEIPQVRADILVACFRNEDEYWTSSLTAEYDNIYGPYIRLIPSEYLNKEEFNDLPWIEKLPPGTRLGVIDKDEYCKDSVILRYEYSMGAMSVIIINKDGGKYIMEAQGLLDEIKSGQTIADLPYVAVRRTSVKERLSEFGSLTLRVIDRLDSPLYVVLSAIETVDVDGNCGMELMVEIHPDYLNKEVEYERRRISLNTVGWLDLGLNSLN